MTCPAAARASRPTASWPCGRGAPGPTRRQDAPFVGRSSELRLFLWAYERAAGETALHLLTVLGGAGVGRTRLVLEAAGRLEGEPALLARLGFDAPDFLGRVQSSRDALALRVGDVLREAASEAGDDDAVGPELLLTLTKALAAAFDPHDTGR